MDNSRFIVAMSDKVLRTFCHRRPPITNLAGSRTSELGLRFTHSYRYECRSRPALCRPSPHPVFAILGEICSLELQATRGDTQ